MHGINFLASYTLGHAIDHVSGLNIGGEQRPVLPVTIGDEASIDQALAFEKGDALFDVRHRFVVSFGAELPTPTQHGRGRGARRRRLAGERHRPGADRLPDRRLRSDDRHPLPDEPAGRDLRSERQRPAHGGSVVQHLAASCAAPCPIPARGPGNAGRNTVRGPGFARTDLSLFKNIDMRASHRIQLRVEAFNLFNQTRFGQPGNQIGTANFGRITSAEDGRIIQLAAKYSF